MIRPVTFVALLLAGTSGLYLYQTKHRAEVLDGQITHTLRQVTAARERIGILRAEWALLNEPDRLGQLSAQHLGLQPLQPSSFVAAADLAARLPVAPVSVADVKPEPLPADAVRVADTAPTQAAAATPAPIVTPPRPTLVVATAHLSAPPAPHPLLTQARAPTHPHAAYRLATSAAPEPLAPPARPPVFASMLRATATPIAAASLGVSQVGLVATRAAIPIVTSALGGYSRSSLAPPIPVGGR